MMKLAGDPARSARAAQAGDPVPRRGLDWLRTLAETPLAEALAAPPVDPLDVPRRAPRITLTRAEARATLSTAAARSALRATADARTASMPNWLDRLGLLRGVPFHYLVPHPDMLPDESLRVFAIDEQWVDALIDGAAGVGIHSSMDQRLNDTLRAATTARSTGARPKAGLLLRSQLVPAWPDMILIARQGTRDLAELRRAHLAPDTLLILFAELPDSLTIREPGQGIHFGIDDEGVLGLRQLTPETTPPLGASLGRDFPDDGTSVFDRFLRRGARTC